MKNADPIDRDTIIYRVHHTLLRIHDLSSEDDLRQWSPKQRRSLRLAGHVTLVVATSNSYPTDGVMAFTVPKLAIMVASPPIRELIVENPEVREIELADGSFEPRAVGILCYWLTAICDWNAQAVPRLPCPDDMVQTLQLRHAAQLLFMDSYVKSFAVEYFLSVQCRIPSIFEAIAVSIYTLDNDDDVLDAWASRVQDLRHSGFLTSSYLDGLFGVSALAEHNKLNMALSKANTFYSLIQGTATHTASPG
ncbi:hypothetical protein IQ07DRAFT_347332 [Pyrenochaeta sp. DS3sAY3a]|nr:hypothetical protein IQ07DRAFT_347332 [Pyrenochaeta sp. DS3sAY3a]